MKITKKRYSLINHCLWMIQTATKLKIYSLTNSNQMILQNNQVPPVARSKAKTILIIQAKRYLHRLWEQARIVAAILNNIQANKTTAGLRSTRVKLDQPAERWVLEKVAETEDTVFRNNLIAGFQETIVTLNRCTNLTDRVITVKAV